MTRARERAAPPDAPAADEGASRRIDKWLWCARRFRSRTLAAAFIESASVRVTRNGETFRVDKPAFALRVGDVVSFPLGERFHAVEVLGFARRRGGPAEAALLAAPVAAPETPPAPSDTPKSGSGRFPPR